MSIKVLRVWFLALSALALALGLGSCGKVAEGNEAFFDSNTNWLLRCREDEQCTGSLRCYCGICTKPCGQNSECGLLSGAECAESGESLCGEQASAGGLCVLACTQDLDCGAGFNCSAGQCVPKPCEMPTVRSWDEVYQLINRDLAGADADDRKNLRYLELGSGSLDSDAGASCGIALSVKRQALSKLLNSLSLKPRIAPPQPIDQEQRIYRIDLRDYGWDRLLLVGGAYNDAWEAIAANDPYALSFVGDDAQDAVADTLTLVPVMLFDSFVAAATRPDIYYGVLDISEQLSAYGTASPGGTYLAALGIEPSSPVFEAGFVEGRTFLAKYWPLGVRSGFLWDIGDDRREWGVLLAQPLAEPRGQHELVFTLPNGLSAFAFMDSDGLRLERWIGSADPIELDGVARPPRSNWRRHPHAVNVRDEIGDYVAANPGAYPAGDLSLLRQRFPGLETLALLLERDFEIFQVPALAALDIDPNAPDPILQGYAEFQRPVTLEVAAAELMVPPEDLRDNLALLDPALAALAGGTVGRDVFTAFYVEALCVLSVVLDNQPDPGRCY